MLTPPTELTFLCLARRSKNEGREFYNFYGHPMLMRMVGDPPFYLVLVTLAADGPYWGWWPRPTERRREPIMFIHPAFVLLDMCFPYGTKAAEKAGQGRVVRVTVKELRVLTDAEANMSTLDQIPELKENA